jgi:ATP-dependent DNA ligase
MEPMLARLVRELPVGDCLLYEPKWDGFRCLASRSGASVDLRSRNRRPLARYFPEITEALLELPADSFLLDGELVIRGDFVALLQRLHPAASLVERRRHETPASLMAFDLMRLGDDDLTGWPFTERRAALERLLRDPPLALSLTPITDDPCRAARWLDGHPGIDGVIVKRRDLRYEPGRRAMQKVKRERTADCVVGGFRWKFDEPAVGSLLLGLYDGAVLRHVGLISAFDARRRRSLLEELCPYAAPLEGHPWEHGFNEAGGPVGRLPGTGSRWDYEWVPLRPELVCEVAHDRADAERFRHGARFRHWRPDREATTCQLDQLDEGR